ncbi:IgGFc-binding protein [Mizuhopecten yessoensis]|uniref:IgGFc-binding protein n=1 Tax=Mizuhopecten yessoensis TaxID=6573 RepID=A0A210QWP4_MIZYE|nr:IgGFc-binding protein [Mizuhopecten yessoensis]
MNSGKNVQIYINIVNPLDTGVLVNISAPRISSFTTKQERVPPKDVIVIEINTADFEITGTGKSGKGILIQSNVSDLIITGLSFALISADMYFARKASQLGTEYIIITHCERNGICQFAVIAREDTTVLEIMFPQYFATSVVFDGTVYGPGDIMVLTLQETQTFQIQSTSDLSGVKIMATNEKRFSVLSGSSQTSMKNSHAHDYIADMVPPLAAWGSEYVLVRRNLTQYFYDYVKFAVAASGANISIIGCGAVLYHQIPKFQTYLFNMTCERVHVISNEPVLIAHFPVGVNHSDPAMFFPTPINHFISKYTIYIPPGFIYCAIAFVIETRQVNDFNFNSFTGSFTNWQEIDQSVYSIAWARDINSGVMEINHTSPFGGHVICERPWVIVALPIGLGNVILKEPQDHLSPSIIADSLTTQNVYETSIDASSTSRTTASKDDTEQTAGTSDSNVSLKMASDVTTIQTHVNASEPMLNCSCCKMPSYSDSDLPPSEILLEITNELKKSLIVPKKTTSKYVRSLSSASDARTSSAAIGGVGIVVLCVVFGSIVAIDIMTLFQKRR